MNHATQCPIEQLAAYVEDRLDEAQHAALIDHLDDCAACQQRLNHLAASEDHWTLAAEALSEVQQVELDFSSIQATHGVRSSEDTARRTPRYNLNAILELLSPSDNPQAAGRIGPFEVVGIVGSGGMGIVLKARDPALDRFVAIKMLAPHLASSQSARRRFAREARAAAAVIHENVIDIYQVAHWNDLPYLVMPYLPDPSLGERLEKEGKLGLESLLSIGLQIARGLSAAHTQGLVHRDVKPANVLLSKGTERAIITDFGLARATDDASLTRAGVLTGTPHYMSPEQARGQIVDQRSDLFSLGSVLFAIASGRPPIDQESGMETIERISRGELPSLRQVAPQAEGWLVELVDWLHQPDPGQRPPSAEYLAEMLEQCLAHHRQPDQTDIPDELLRPRFRTIRSRLRASSRMRKFAWGGASVGLLALLFFPGAPWKPLHRQPGKQERVLPAPGEPPESLLDYGSAQPEQPISGNLTDWHGMDGEIESLSESVNVLEQRVHRPWSLEPASNRAASSRLPDLSPPLNTDTKEP